MRDVLTSWADDVFCFFFLFWFVSLMASFLYSQLSVVHHWWIEEAGTRGGDKGAAGAQAPSMDMNFPLFLKIQIKFENSTPPPRTLIFKNQLPGSAPGRNFVALSEKKLTSDSVLARWCKS